MRELPDFLNFYKKTPEFTEKSVPSGLLKNHNTKAGVWGKIVVSEGILEYHIDGIDTDPKILTPNQCGIVEPEIVHFVKPVGSVKFHVEFYKK